MLRRAAAALMSRRPANLSTASSPLPSVRQPQAHLGLPRHHLSTTPSPLPSVRQPQAPLGLWRGGVRGYARMARRLPPARPDGYSTSDSEPALEEDLEPHRPGADDDGEDSDGSEMEGFMLEYGSGSDDDDDDEEKDK